LAATTRTRLIAWVNWLTGIGYALSIVSVAFLAWFAWPGPPRIADPSGDHRRARLSVVGMALSRAALIVQNRKIAEDD
jgi:hypothetical protein